MSANDPTANDSREADLAVTILADAHAKEESACADFEKRADAILEAARLEGDLHKGVKTVIAEFKARLTELSHRVAHLEAQNEINSPEHVIPEQPPIQ